MVTAIPIVEISRRWGMSSLSLYLLLLILSSWYLAGLFLLNYLDRSNIPSANQTNPEGNTCKSNLAVVATKIARQSPDTLYWSKPASWTDGVVPGLTDVVTIPSGSKMKLDQSITVEAIMVQGLLDVELKTNINIRTNRMIVSGVNSMFRWGRSNMPYLKQGSITLYGNDAAKLTNELDAEYKAIIARDGGVLEIHGAPKSSWVKLNKTVLKDENKITLETPVNWVAGDSIVVSSTDYNYSNAEVMVIQSISGATITFQSAFRKTHFGEIISFNQSSKKFDQRAEVGLLSRNIKITGEVTNVGARRMSGHVMVMKGGVAHIENVSFNNLGREGVKGKYPFHWHLCGPTSNQYVRNASIRNSFNRLVVVHGTNNTLVESVLGFQHIGHGFMLEDGDEEFNVFKKNLGMSSFKAKEGAEVDVADGTSVATFWISNPNNSFEGNVAAGGQGIGFWIIPVNRLLRQGAALSKGGVPRNYSFRKFDANTSHSNRNINLSIDSDIDPQRKLVDLQPQYPLLDVNNDTLTYLISNLTVYKGGNRGVWTRAGLVHKFVNCSFGDSPFMAFISYNGHVENSVFAASTLNQGTGPDYERGEILGLQMYNGSCDFINVHMAGFKDQSKVCIGNRQSSGKYPNFTARGITFENDGTQMQKVNLGYFSLEEDPARSYAFAAGMIDLDGTLSGKAGVRITPKIKNFKTDPYYADKIFDEKFNQPSQINNVVSLPETWNAVGSQNTEFGLLHNYYSWGEDESLRPARAIYGIRSDGPVVFDELRKSHDSQWPVMVNSSEVYYSQFHQTPDFIRSTFKWTKVRNGAVIAAYMNVPTATVLTLPKVTNMATLMSSSSSAYFISNNTLYVKYVANKISNGLNTSTKHTDYITDEYKIQFNAFATPYPNKRLDAVYLADFDAAVDTRAAIQASLTTGTISSITHSSATKSNSFTIQKNSNSDVGWVDYILTLENKQVWREFNKLNIVYKGPKADVLVSNVQGLTTKVGALSANTTANATSAEIDLSSLHESVSQEVTKITLRYFMKDISGSQRAELFEMTLSMSRVAQSIPTLTASIRDTLCANGSVLLTASPGDSYLWKRGTTVLPASTRSIMAAEPGVYTVEVRTHGVSQTSLGTEIFSLPEANVTPSGSTRLCAGEVLQLSTPAVSGYSYQWMKGKINLGNTNVSVLNVNTTGNFSVQVQNTHGCTKRSAITNVALITPIYWYSDRDADGSGSFFDSVLACIQPQGYVSFKNDACPDNAEKNSPGVCGCAQSETACKPQVRFIQPQPEAQTGASIVVLVEAISTNSTIANVKLYLDGSVTPVRQENNSPYAWNTTSGGTLDPILNSLSPGPHQLRAEATDALGRRSEQRITIYVNVLAPTSLQNARLEFSSFYPNPVESSLHSQLPEGSEVLHVSAKNTVGETILLPFQLRGNYIMVDCEALRAGMYLLEIQTSAGKEVFKILKQ